MVFLTSNYRGSTLLRFCCWWEFYILHAILDLALSARSVSPDDRSNIATGIRPDHPADDESEHKISHDVPMPSSMSMW